MKQIILFGLIALVLVSGCNFPSFTAENCGLDKECALDAVFSCKVGTKFDCSDWILLSGNIENSECEIIEKVGDVCKVKGPKGIVYFKDGQFVGYA